MWPAFLESFTLVAVAELGDKTQLLSMLLAAQFRKFWPIVWGILVATLINHALTALAGNALASWVESQWLTLGVSILFIAMGIWVLIPDASPIAKTNSTRGAFITSTIAFFVAELGDKTQLATFTLGAKYLDATMMVIFGTTIAMMLVNIPAVLLGEKILERLPMKTIRAIASVIFLSLGAKGMVELWF